MPDVTPPSDDPNRSLDTLRIIAISLIFGLASFGAFATWWALAPKGDPPSVAPRAGENRNIALFGLAVGMVGVAAGLFAVPRWVAIRPPRATGPEATFFVEWVIRAALIEGAAFFQFVLVLVTGNPLLLVGGAIALAALLGIYPTRRRFSAWLAARGAVAPTAAGPPSGRNKPGGTRLPA